MYELIKNLRPYFFSLREIGENVSLDIKFPIKWKFDYEHPTLEIVLQEKNEKVNLVSFVMPATSEGYDTVNTVALSIIKFNLEQEEKEQLFQDKINELKDLFAKSSLDKLKEINFLDNETKSQLPLESGDGVAK